MQSRTMTKRFTRPISSAFTRNGVSGGSSVPAFVPTDVSSLELWLDASDSSTVLTSIGPNVAASNGETVRRWLDKSGNERHANQATLANRPEYQTASVNSRNAIFVNGASFGLVAPIPVDAVGTVLSVWELDVKSQLSLFGNADSLATLLRGIDGNFGATPNSLSGTIFYYRNGLPITIGNTNDAHDEFADRRFLVEISNVDFTRADWDDGLLEISWSPNTDLFPLGHVCEVMVFSSNITQAERNNLGAYLNAKWNFPYLQDTNTYDLLSWTPA